MELEQGSGGSETSPGEVITDAPNDRKDEGKHTATGTDHRKQADAIADGNQDEDVIADVKKDEDVIENVKKR